LRRRKIELLPAGRQAVAHDDGLKAGCAESAGLTALEQSGLVLGATNLRCDGASCPGRAPGLLRTINIMFNICYALISCDMHLSEEVNLAP
jgi:hypothetical protein